MPDARAGLTNLSRRLEPLALAARAAFGFTRTHGILHAMRLVAAGLTMLGPRGLVRRAAAEARQREDDSRYQAWLTTHTPGPRELAQLKAEVAGLRYQPRISIVTPVFNTAPAWLRRWVESVRAQVYSNWELCVCDDGSTNPETRAALQALSAEPRIRVVRSARKGGIVQASNAALALATGDFVGFLDSDDELSPDALAEVVRCLNTNPDLDVVYTDEDKIDHAGVRSQPHFKPDWSPELLRSCMYISHLTVMRRSLAESVGRFRAGTDGAQDYDLMLRATEATSRIAHVPKVLYHWGMAETSGASSRLEKPWAVEAGRRALEEHLRRRAIDAEVLPAEARGHYRVRYAVAGTPAVSILITAPPAVAGNRRFLEWLALFERRVRYSNHEVVVAGEGAPAAAARRARGDHVLVMAPFATPASSGWIRALLEFSQQPEIGAVGGIVLMADGTIENAGIVLGGGVRPAFRSEPQWTRGHLSNILDVRNCAAVGAACLMTRRAVLEQVGGFDELLGDGWNVDYCLRVREAGLRVAVTPYAQIRVDRAGASVSPRDLAHLEMTWGDRLKQDPFYNRNFDQDLANFRLPDTLPPTRSR